MRVFKIRIYLLMVFVVCLGFVACSKSTGVETFKLGNLTDNKNSAVSTSNIIKAENVLTAFKQANLPVVDEVIYTEENDPNHLLSRPNQYIGKIKFDDRRNANNESPRAQTIEIFANLENLEKRKTYAETISKSGAMLAQYIYSHKNILLRLNHALTPAQATEYETVLKSL